MSALPSPRRDSTPDEAEAAIRDLAGRSAREPARADACLCHLARWEAWRGEEEAAVSAYRRGGAALDRPGRPPPWAPAELAILLAERGEAEEARRIALVGLERAPSQALTVALAEALAAGAEAPDLRERLAEAVLARPADRLLLERFLERLEAEDGTEATLDWLEMVQDSSPEPLRAPLLALAERRGEARVRARFGGGVLAAFAARPEAAATARLWEAVRAGRAPNPADRALAAAAEPWVAELHFRFLAPPALNLALFAEGGEAALRSAGVAFEPLHRFVRDFLAPGTEAWARRLDDLHPGDPEAREVVRRAEAAAGYMDRIVATGRLTMADPLTGEAVTAREGLVVYGRALYRFEGRESFWLVATGPWAGAVGLHLPRLGLSISFAEAPALPLEGEQLANALAALLRRAAASPPAAPAVPRPGPVLLVAHTENLAHHVWNFYSAVERLILTGLHRRLGRVLFSGTEFFGPLEAIFPELAEVGVERPRRANILDPAPDDPSRLVVRSGGFLIPRSLTRRLMGTATGGPRNRRSGVEPAEVERDPRAPVLWLGLRLRDKSWVGQESGLLRVIERVRARHPRATFLLDGYSYPVGEDGISDQWREVIARLSVIARRIREAAHEPTSPVVDLVGNSMRESLMWARETDAYLAPYGTTQHKIGWFTDAPGVVYVPPAFWPSTVSRSPGATAAEIAARPTFVFGEAASPGERRGLNRGRERQSNLHLDADHLADLLLPLVERRLSSRLPTAERSRRRRHTAS